MPLEVARNAQQQANSAQRSIESWQRTDVYGTLKADASQGYALAGRVQRE